MRKLILSLPLVAMGAVIAPSANAQQVILQLGPTTPYSTIDCANFVKLPNATWKAVAPVPFGLGFVQGIIPPARPIASGSNIYNNIDLYSQLNSQCGSAPVVSARY